MPYIKLCNCNEKKIDKLDRQKHIEPLTTLLTNIKDESFVMTVSAPYGGGKTFFIEKWKEVLQNNGCKTLYYNAWENDFAVNPLASFIASFESLKKNNSPKFNEKATAVINAAKSIGYKQLPSILISLFSEICKNKFGIDTETFSKIVTNSCEFVDEAEKNINSVNDQANKQISEEELLRQTIERFKKSLEALINGISARKNTNYPTAKLIIFIDDLDRCRPDYTIKFLEYIKHLFNVPNCIFVLAVDEEQLKSAVEKVYGSQNAEGFLKRIIDFKFQLPEPSVSNLIDFYIKELGWSYCKRESDDIFYVNFAGSKYLDIFSLINLEMRREIFIRTINNLVAIIGLTARDLEHLLQDLNIIFKSVSRKRLAPVYVAIMYIVDNYYVPKDNEIKNNDKFFRFKKELESNAIAKYKDSNITRINPYNEEAYEVEYCSSLNDFIKIFDMHSIPKGVRWKNEAYCSLSEELLRNIEKPLDLRNTVQQQIDAVFCEKMLENLEQ